VPAPHLAQTMELACLSGRDEKSRQACRDSDGRGDPLGERVRAHHKQTAREKTTDVMGLGQDVGPRTENQREQAATLEKQ
jgi:hypothetical protein